MNEREIFAAALDCPTDADRRAFLDGLGDPALCGRIEALLEQRLQLGSYLEHPPVDALAAGLDATILLGDGSTYDAAENDACFGPESMTPNPAEKDDEIPLGFLQPSTRADSLGRLAHYEILEALGQGAFGIVLKAFDEKLQRVVAIKVLSPHLAATSPARKRFTREARASAKVRHENVVSIYVVEDEPIPYLVMEYVPGETLQKRLDDHGPLDLHDVLRLGKQIADGLAAAHTQDLIHRDVKPGNILLDTSLEDHVKITDFGLARTADDASMTQSGMIAGTPLYMAPEQALGHKLDTRADLFSFGSVLYQMLTGRPPFRAPSTVAVLKRVTEDTPRPIQEIIPEVPDWMCALVGHLHAKQPDERYGSAKEVSKLLATCLADVEQGRLPKIPAPRRAIEHSNTPAEKVSVAEKYRPRAANWAARWPVLRIAAVVLVVLFAALGISEATGVSRLTSTVIRLATGSGTLVIETDDPDLKIAIDGEEVTIRGGGVAQLTLRPGPHKVAAIKNGEPWKEELVTITRNGREVVRMSLEPNVATTKSDSTQLSQTTGAAFSAPQDRLRAELVLNGHTGAIRGVAWSPNGERIVTGSADGTIKVCDATTGRETFTIRGHQDTVTSVAWSPNGDRILSGSDDKTVRVWDAVTGETILTLRGHADGVKSVAWSPSGDRILSGSADKTAKVWDAVTGQSSLTLKGHDLQIYSVAWSPDGGSILTGSPDKTARVWDATTGKEALTLRHETRVFTVAWSPDGERILCGADQTANVWDATTGETRLILETGNYRIWSVAWSPDGQRIVTGPDGMSPDKTLKVWDATTGQPTLNLQGNKRGVWCVAWRPDGERIVNGPDGGAAMVWNVPPVMSPFTDADVQRIAALPPTFTSSIGMEFVIVPKGKSWLGGGKDKLGNREVEIPADFYLGKYEVTQEEWEKVMAENPSHFSRTGDGKDAVKDINDADLKRFPVEMVSWDQCQLFVAKLNQREKEAGWVYRLPTGVEWEYACRGGPLADKADSAFDFYFAKPTNTLLSEQANVGGELSLPRTCKVGSYEGNRLGLFDMHGNVQEWCDSGDSRKELRGGSSWRGNGSANSRFIASQGRFFGTGLRLARVPSSAPSPAAKTPPVVASLFTDADVQRIAALPAAQQIEEVRQELMRRNPGFDGELRSMTQLKPIVRDGVVIDLRLCTDHVSDISPVRALTGLRVVWFQGSSPGGRLTDLSPLKELALTSVSVSLNRQLSDLSPLEGMPITVLGVAYTGVANIAVVKGMPIIELYMKHTTIADLSPLAGKSLRVLSCPQSSVKTLQGLPANQVEHLGCDLTQLPDKAELARLGVTHINGKPVAEFFKEGGVIEPQATEASPPTEAAPP